MAYCLWLFILTSIAHGLLQDNSNFVKIECATLATKSDCDIQSHHLCEWNDTQSICEDNYNPIIFISAFDFAATAKSLISFILLLGCMFLYWFAGFLTRKWKVFKDVDPDKLQKCQIYIFELIGLTLCLSYLIYTKTLDIIFHAENYSDFGPESTLNLIRSLSAFVFLMYLYCIEMITSTMRWSLKLHHIIIMSTVMYIEWILFEYADLDALRCALCVGLYALTEHNVCAQLLLYKVAPLWCWPLHLISAILYVLTRLFVTGSFIYCYIDWAMTDSIKHQINGKLTKHYPYLVFFFSLPLAIILINIAQFHTMKALFYVCKSVHNKYQERNALLYYPRLQSLYDMFVSFDSERCGWWTFVNFRKFIYHYSSFIKEDTCIILWNVLGFSYMQIDENVMEEIEIAPSGWMDKQRERQLLTPRDFNNIDNVPMSIKRKAKMKWRHFGKIFGQHVISKKFIHHSVETVVGAQIQILLQTVFDVQAQFGRYGAFDKDKAIMKLYASISKLVDGKKKKKTSTLAQEIQMSESMDLGVINTTTIEMILNPSFINNVKRNNKKQLDVVYDDDDAYDGDRHTTTAGGYEEEEEEDIESSTNASQTHDGDIYTHRDTQSPYAVSPNTVRLSMQDGEATHNKTASYQSSRRAFKGTDDEEEHHFKGTDDLRDAQDWNISLDVINNEDDDGLSTRAIRDDDEEEEEEEQKRKDMLFRIMMHGPDGKPLRFDDDHDDTDAQSYSNVAHARTAISVMGTMQAVRNMLDDDSINEWI